MLRPVVCPRAAVCLRVLRVRDDGDTLEACLLCDAPGAPPASDARDGGLRGAGAGERPGGAQAVDAASLLPLLRDELQALAAVDARPR